MSGNTKSTSVKKLLGASMAVPALAAAGVAVTATPAAAAWNDCSAPGYNCWFSGTSGGGALDVFGTNDGNTQAVNSQSGWNRKTSERACGYLGVDWTDSINYNRPPGDQENYSVRTHRSIKFVSVNVSCPVPV